MSIYIQWVHKKIYVRFVHTRLIRYIFIYFHIYTRAKFQWGMWQFTCAWLVEGTDIRFNWFGCVFCWQRCSYTTTQNALNVNDAKCARLTQNQSIALNCNIDPMHMTTTQQINNRSLLVFYMLWTNVKQTYCLDTVILSLPLLFVVCMFESYVNCIFEMRLITNPSIYCRISFHHYYYEHNFQNAADIFAVVRFMYTIHTPETTIERGSVCDSKNMAKKMRHLFHNENIHWHRK